MIKNTFKKLKILYKYHNYDPVYKQNMILHSRVSNILVKSKEFENLKYINH